MNLNQSLRALAISLLDDDDGIDSNAYENLQTVFENAGADGRDIWDSVKGVLGRVYLPSDHGLHI